MAHIMDEAKTGITCRKSIDKQEEEDFRKGRRERHEKNFITGYQKLYKIVVNIIVKMLNLLFCNNTCSKNTKELKRIQIK